MSATYQFQLHILGEEASPTFRVPLGASTIGRLAGNALVLENDQVSRKHAQLDCTLAECQITDLKSSNFTYVNGEKLIPGIARVLVHGDTVKIGPFQLRFEAVPVPEEKEEEPQPPEVEARPGVLDHPPLVEQQPPVAQPVDLMPPPPPEEPPGGNGSAGEAAPEPVPSGLSLRSQRLIQYLPGIYQTDFMERFLGIFESIQMPLEWNIDNFDLFLDPATAPADFLPWLANWFGITFQPGWTEAQRRELLQCAGQIYARRGTRLALGWVLRIFTGHEAQIEDTAADLPPYTFRVRLPLRQSQVNLDQLHQLICAHKPAHASYILEFAR